MAVELSKLIFPMTMGDVFEIRVAKGSVFAEKWADQLIYQIVNVHSNVVEGEAFSLARAMLQARASEMSVERLQADNLYDQEVIAMENMFDDMDSNNDPELTKPN